MSAKPLPASQTQAEIPSTANSTAADSWADDKQYYLQLLRKVAETGAETLELVKQNIHSRAKDLQSNAVDPDDKWFMGHITTPFTDPQNKFAQDASTAIDTLSRSIRLTIMLAQKLAHEPPTPPSAAPRQPIRREGEAEIHPDVANDDPATAENQRPDNQRHETDSLRPDRPDREDAIPARPISHHVAEIMREFMRVEAEFQKRLTPQHLNTPADTPQAAVRAAPTHCETPTPPNAHQPGPSNPPTPFPRL